MSGEPARSSSVQPAGTRGDVSLHSRQAMLAFASRVAAVRSDPAWQAGAASVAAGAVQERRGGKGLRGGAGEFEESLLPPGPARRHPIGRREDRKSTRLNSSHMSISY